MSGPSTTTPYSFIKRGTLFIVPVRPTAADVPYVQTITKPRDYSLWVNGGIEQPAFQLDRARMPPSMYQDVRDDLVTFSPVEVSRSAFTRSNHAYVGVIDSKGAPYYFTLDSRGISVRKADVNDDRVWKTFDRLSDHEREMATQERRVTAAREMTDVERELSEPKLVIIVKSEPSIEVLSKAEKHTGTMVSLHLPQELAERISLPGGEEPSSMHVTLAYLGKDLTYEQKISAVCAVRRFAQQAGSIKATLGGVGRFSASHTSEGNDVVYLSVDSPDITRLRPKLLEELAAEGIEPSNAHGFVPHVTLQYVKTTARTPIKRFPPVVVEFLDVSLVVAEHQMRFPFMQAATALVVSAQDVNKALPKKSKEAPVKKTPTKKVSKKKVGAGGKVRYTYPNEKKGAAKKKPAGKKPGAKKPPGAKQQQVPLIVATDHDDSKHADPGELANQLGVSVRTLQHTARRMGREDFSKFMRSHLKRFAAKHRLDPDYWGTLYVKLRSTDPKRQGEST